MAKERAERPAKKRGRKKRVKEQANPVRPEYAVKIQLQMPARIYGTQDWADVEELWRGEL